MPQNRLVVVWFLVCVASIAMGCGETDPIDEVRILECTGTCTCDEETRTCSCAGGTECTLEGAGDVIFQCDGNASCDLTCADDCDIVCPGTTGCTAKSGRRARFECQGTASCDFTCLADCSVYCGGATRCVVRCDNEETCDLSECRGATSCGENVFACGISCPEA